MLFDAEGLGHKGGVQSVLLGDLFQLFEGFVRDGLIVNLLEGIQQTGRALLEVLPFVLYSLDGSQIGKLDILTLVIVFFQQPPPSLPLALLLLPQSP